MTKQAAVVQETESQSLGYSSPVDMVHLSAMTFGDRGLEREIFQLFKTQSLICVERLRASSDYESRKMLAHTIKGSARGIGAWLVAERAESLERLQDGPTAVASAIDELAAAIGETNSYIDRVLADT